MDKKILILIGNARRHKYFANQISAHYPLQGIIVERKYSPKNRLSNFLEKIHYNPLKLIEKIFYKICLTKIDKRYEKAEVDILLKGRKNIDLPKSSPLVYTDDINSEKTKEFIRKSKPDLILISGTSLIKNDIITLMPTGTMINMHTGLSPYYRGGPCTFWCLYNAELEYLGVTIHFMTPGIDSGNIILSSRMMDITPDDNEATLDCKVIKLGVSLMLKAIEMFFDRRIKAIPQWEKGKVFYSKDFTPQNRLALEKKLKEGLVQKYLTVKAKAEFENIKTIN